METIEKQVIDRLAMIIADNGEGDDLREFGKLLNIKGIEKPKTIMSLPRITKHTGELWDAVGADPQIVLNAYNEFMRTPGETYKPSEYINFMLEKAEKSDKMLLVMLTITCLFLKDVPAQAVIRILGGQNNNM